MAFAPFYYIYSYKYLWYFYTISLHPSSKMSRNYRFISAEQKWLILTMSLRGQDIVSANAQSGVRTVLASLTLAHFLVWERHEFFCCNSRTPAICITRKHSGVQRSHRAIHRPQWALKSKKRNSQ